MSDSNSISQNGGSLEKELGPHGNQPTLRKQIGVFGTALIRRIGFSSRASGCHMNCQNDENAQRNVTRKARRFVPVRAVGGSGRLPPPFPERIGARAAVPTWSSMDGRRRDSSVSMARTAGWGMKQAIKPSGAVASRPRRRPHW